MSIDTRRVVAMDLMQVSVKGGKELCHDRGITLTAHASPEADKVSSASLAVTCSVTLF